MRTSPPILLKGVKVHNLKSVDLTLEHHQLIVFTGVSGSGKSSLAFDTIYVEGQRRYVESLSTYARRHLGDLTKPDAELISGISPTIAIEQKTSGRNPRSTVGTITGIYDFLRVLYARLATPYCPISQEPVKPLSAEQILEKILSQFKGEAIILLSPYAKAKKGEFKEDFSDLSKRGFMRVRVDGKIENLTEELSIDGKVAHDVDLVIDRLTVAPSEEKRIAESLTQALELGNGVVKVLKREEECLFSRTAFSEKSGLSYEPLDPSDFSFNHPLGMCPTCLGLGISQEFDLEKVINPDACIAEDCCVVASSYNTVRYKNIYDNLAKLYDFSVTTPWKKLSKKAQEIFLYGVDKKWIRMQFVHPTKKTKWTDFVKWKGVLGEAKERFQKAESSFYQKHMKALMHESICPACSGGRLKPYPGAARLQGKKIHEIAQLSVEEALDFFQNITFSKEEEKIAEELLKEICERLFFLKDVGLHYLSLERTAPTLSGGESQRVRLASQIGSGLVGATYVLDEPSIGLHPRDNLHLLKTLKKLKNLGNTVIVVEHDQETIAAADWIVDVGPLAGKLGGKVIVSGKLKELLASEESITGAYLSGRKTIAIPKKRKKKETLKILGASHHNLKKVDFELPLGLFVAVTGVSGSGKSSLITDTLFPALSNHFHGGEMPVGKHAKMTGVEALDKVIAIDQTPIGRTPRSNPATYIKLFDEIRDLFSELPESLSQGYKPGRFSFNVKEGSCPHCSGMGMLKIDMDFMEDAWVTCEQCEGKRFDSTTLSVLYKGKNISDILSMTVEEAALFFESIPSIYKKLNTLLKVGLGYIQIGQPSPTLSGGEAQRIKLAKELSRPSTGKTLYVLDEPTTGLHFHDIAKLLDILQELVTRGNSLVVIEHNTDLIKVADWVVDLGPEGGKGGGEIISTGPPEKIATLETPTGIALRESFKPFKPPQEIVLEQKQVYDTQIVVKNASQNTLKKVSTEIERGKITICTGPSGSGKSSFAFETVYAEGQRRYVESLSPYARQFIKQSLKPKVESITGLSPAIAIEQKSHAGNPRSTIGTITEIYDFLRVLYAHLGIAYCPETGEKIETISKEFVASKLLEYPEGTKVQILSPLTLKRGESFATLKERLEKTGYLRIRLNHTYYALDEEIPFDPQRKNSLFLVIDRLIIGSDIKKRLLTAITQASDLSKGTLVADLGEDLFFNLAFAVLKTGKSYPAITPHTFSFNTESGMCQECLGLGFQYGAHFERDPSFLRYTPINLLYRLWKEKAEEPAIALALFCLEREGIDPEIPLKKIEKSRCDLFFQGSSTFHPYKGFNVRWVGINTLFQNLSRTHNREIKEVLLPLFAHTECPSCQGSRLKPLARHVNIEGITLPKLCQLPISEAFAFLKKLHISKDLEFLKETHEQLLNRLLFLEEIGLGYLSLERSAPTLSGGETQRIRLARQLGASLTGTLYVLDEPTIGLHPADIHRLNQALKKLTSLGNTLLLVEHDPLTLALADHIIDFGPKAGREGGEIIATGTLEEIKKNPLSLTGAYLSGKKKIPIPKKRRPVEAKLSLTHATLHNLHNVSVDFPLNTLTCITGVSGSGKSTLIGKILQPALTQALSTRKIQDPHTFQGATLTGTSQLTQVQILTQNPIGHTNRADISTYVDLLSPLRYFFASLPEAKMRGLAPKNFSFNHVKGMCTECQGLGVRHISLQFLPPVTVTCTACNGFRFNPLSLQVKYQGKHLGNILNMTVNEALDFLPPIPKVLRILKTLIAVGLDYLTLSQEIGTLSGGEAQRLRLSTELAKRSPGHTLYLFDEPSVGLHSDDIAKLLLIFHSLVDKGHSVILIEHNLDLIRNADYLIDMGPLSGKQGGKIVATGTPEEVAKNKNSLTGQFLQTEKI